jgi:MerR family mercuric resistance operon transcriptional regulator
MQTLTIGQLAKQANVNVETIRFYERKSLIPEPPRRESGYRQYPKSEIARIRFIKRAQVLGFTLKEICELLALRVDPDTDCADIKRQAEIKITQIQEKIAALEKMHTALTKLVVECISAGTTSECPILEYLEIEESPADDD